MFDPLKPPKFPPCVSRGNLFGIYPFPDESAHVCQMWCQSVQLFDSFPTFEFVSRGAICLAYIHFQMNLHMCQIWCQSVQPFGSFSRICAKVSSALSHCARCLVQNTPKNNIYTLKFIIPTRSNLTTSTSLTFFIAIFSVQCHVRAGTLMVMCQHVTTELYRSSNDFIMLSFKSS